MAWTQNSLVACLSIEHSDRRQTTDINTIIRFASSHWDQQAGGSEVNTSRESGIRQVQRPKDNHASCMAAWLLDIDNGKAP
eukprot:scaffold20186_cov71-Cyclotella_meneghiniana.AAC.7